MKFKEIIKINKEYGGKLVRPSSLEFATKSQGAFYYKNSLILRAIVVDHPFDDFNKSTAGSFLLRQSKKYEMICNEEKMIKGILRIAKRNITDLNKIERSMRTWFQKKK